MPAQRAHDEAPSALGLSFRALLLAVVIAASPATARAADPIWIVPASDADLALAQYLAASFHDASVRLELRGMPLASLIPLASGAVLILVDRRQRAIVAVLPGAAEPSRRDLPHEVAESPFAVAVIVSELIGLPLAEPAEPTSPDDAPRETPTAELPIETATGTESTPPAEETTAEETAAEETPAEETVEDTPPEDTPPLERTVVPDELAVRLRVSLGYALWVAPSPLTIVHRPGIELGMTLGLRAIRLLVAVQADVAGFAGGTLPMDVRFELRRNDVRLTMAALSSVLDPIELELGATLGLGWTSVELFAGGASVVDERFGLVAGATAAVTWRVVDDFRVFLGADVLVDGDARRYLADGNPFTTDGPVSVVARAGARWETH